MKLHTYKYPRPAVTVDAILISDQNSVLLIERGAEPFLGKWALPGGFIDMDEELEEACKREVEEETGLKIESLKQFKAFGQFMAIDITYNIIRNKSEDNQEIRIGAIAGLNYNLEIVPFAVFFLSKETK